MKRAGAGRPKGDTAPATQERILASAEALFADGGFNGTSIRDISAAAGVGLAVVTYHFGSKDDLFEAVVKRRSIVLNAQRERVLEQARVEAGDGPIPLATLVRGYIAPFITFARTEDAGWQNYAVLMGRLANSPRGTAVIHRHSDSIAETYITEFLRALPGAKQIDVVTGFVTMVSAMLTVCASTGRLEALAGAFGCAVTDKSVTESLIAFCVDGFAAAGRTVSVPPKAHPRT